MKIIIIGPGVMEIPPKGWGAVEILIWDYYQELTNLGHDVKIVNTNNVQQIIQETNDFEPDFVHLQYDNFYHIMSHIKCSNKAATTHYGYLEQPHRYGGYQQIMNGFLAGDFRIFCLSEGIKNTYIKFGCDPNRLEVTPNGARPDLFRYIDYPVYPNRSIYLAKITDRKRQFLYQYIKDLYFAGNQDDHRFNFNSQQYLGEWSKDTLYSDLTKYSNLVLLSDGEADPLVTKEALMAGLGLVVSEYSTANLDLSLPFIEVIPNDKLTDLNYIESVLINNRKISNILRSDIREYAIKNFSWSNLVKEYVKLI